MFWSTRWNKKRIYEIKILKKHTGVKEGQLSAYFEALMKLRLWMDDSFRHRLRSIGEQAGNRNITGKNGWWNRAWASTLIPARIEAVQSDCDALFI